VIATVVQTPQGQVGQVLAASQTRNTGNLYIFEDTTTNYGHLSHWWDNEVRGYSADRTTFRGLDERLPIRYVCACQARRRARILHGFSMSCAH